MKIKKKDFIELDFTAKTENGGVFDTTKSEDAKEANLPETEYKPLKICVGEGQLLKGLDAALEGKEIGKEHEITLQPEEAFGRRDPKLVKIIPLKIFHEKEVNPYPGLSIAIDNTIATVRAVSGGRVITDFNHPLAGKRVVYKVNLLRKLDSSEEKIGVLIRLYLRTDKFSVKGKEIVVETVNEAPMKDAEEKIKELIGDFVVKIKENKSKAKNSEEAENDAEKKKV